MAKFRVNRTFRDDSGAWRIQGTVIELLLDAARQYLVARCIVPILDSITAPAKKVIESAEKKIEGVENAVKNQKQKGN
jgi:hypothetical protein